MPDEADDLWLGYSVTREHDSDAWADAVRVQCPNVLSAGSDSKAARDGDVRGTMTLRAGYVERVPGSSGWSSEMGKRATNAVLSVLLVLGCAPTSSHGFVVESAARAAVLPPDTTSPTVPAESGATSESATSRTFGSEMLAVLEASPFTGEEEFRQCMASAVELTANSFVEPTDGRVRGKAFVAGYLAGKRDGVGFAKFAHEMMFSTGCNRAVVEAGWSDPEALEWANDICNADADAAKALMGFHARGIGWQTGRTEILRLYAGTNDQYAAVRLFDHGYDCGHEPRRAAALGACQQSWLEGCVAVVSESMGEEWAVKWCSNLPGLEEDTRICKPTR